MLNDVTTFEDDPQQEIAALVRTLHETHKRLQELAGGEVDAVISVGGQSYLLHEAQEKLRRSEAVQHELAGTQSSILNALPAHIALLDHAGVIISVNEGWRQYAEANRLDSPSSGVGMNYLEICEQVQGDGAGEASAAAAGVRANLSGAASEFSLDYPCHSPTEQRWFQLKVKPLENGGPRGAVVMHVDITQSKLAEETVRESESRYRSLFENMLEGFMHGRLLYEQGRACDYIYLAVNGAFETQTGLSNVTGRKVSEVVPGMHEANPEQLELYSRVAATGQPERFETYAKKLGIWFSVSVYSPEKGHFVAVFDNITVRKRAEEALQRQTTELRVLFDLVPAMIWFKDTQNGILRVNQRVAETTGMRIEEIEGKSGWEIFPGQADKHYADDLEVIRSGAPKMGIVEELPGPGGAERWVQTDKVPVLDSDGNVTGLIAMVQDITERKLATGLLIKNQRRLALATESARLGIWDWDVIANDMVWDDRMYEIYGIREQDFSGAYDAWNKGLHPEDRERAEADLAAALGGIKEFHTEFRIVWPDGQVRHIEGHGVVHRTADGVAVQMIGVNWDITELKIRERELTRANRALRLLSASNEALIRAEAEPELLERICRIAVETGGYCMAWVGYAQDDEARSIKPMACAGAEEGFFSEVTISWNRHDPSGLGPSGQVIRTGHAVVCPDFQSDPALAHWHVAANKRGFRGVIMLPLSVGQRTFGCLGLYSSDINDPGIDEVRLLQELAANLAFGIVHLRARIDQQRLQAAVLKVAAGVSATTGAAFYEQLARNMADAVGAQAGFVSQLHEGEPPSASTLAAVVDGTVIDSFDYVIEGTPCENLVVSDSCVIARQVVEQFPQAERLAALGAQAYVGRRLDGSTGEPLGHLFVVFREPLKDTGFVTSTMQIFAARAASELERQQTDAQVREQAALIDESRDAIVVRDLDHRITFWSKGAERLYGWNGKDVQGRFLHELLEVDPVTFAEADRAVRETGEWNGEIQKRARNQTLLTLNGRWTLMRAANGQPRSILSIDTDITEQKKIQEQFLRAQRMESIGTLAGGIAHDLNNALSPMMMSLEILARRFPDPKSADLLSVLKTSTQRGAEMVRQVLSFARGVESRPVELQLRHIIEEIEKIANDTFLKLITVKTNISPDLWTVVGDPTQIHQVMLNLCVNARDAMPGGGVLTLSAENCLIDGRYAALNLEGKAGPYVCLEVSDTGTGIPPEVIEKIFDPFFTTKEVGKGTGLGLSTSLAIIKAHGGFLRLDSGPDNGTTFKVYFPALPGATPAEGAEVAAELPPGDGELILVVDDEASVRAITQVTLETFGYRVLVACDGAGAIALYASQHAEIAVVLTDMTMPVMDDEATILLLRKINPGVRIVAASGLPVSSAVANKCGLEEKHFLPKPYTAETLLKTLRQILTVEPEPIM